MSRPTRIFGSLLLTLAIAACIGVSLWGLVATAQEIAHGIDAPFAAPTADEFLLQGALAVLLVGIGVRVLRQMFREQLAPTPATVKSRRLVMAACLLLGAGLGVIGTAPAVAAGIAGKLVGGLGTGGLAYFGAGLLGSKLRGEKKAKAAPDVAP